ncbi:dynein regulatory complex protein 11 isoform X1 [Carassius auratus]|uniref:Dynein regulatory complex protein 11 isoform X1 n=2 Tax=Carassius auratus TaxID=7957 RepID=A0A6P6PAE5_CARAU|nr:dynein regulatory complex protein 11-like isoform X1 [Carassius auratus]
MSQSSYGQMWDAAQGALADLLEDEYPTMQLRPQKDRLQGFQTLATFYLRYLKIFRALEEVYDQIVHPQKRRVVHQVLEGVMGRLVELKNEMVELEYSEFHYFDDILQDFKMTPEDLEVPIPRYFVREKIRALKEREKMLAHILAKGGHQKPKTVPVQFLSVERAVWLLQVSERARQGRLRAHFMKTIRQEEQRRLQGNSSMLDPNQAATCIQKVWRGYWDRTRVNKECLEEMIFLGMIPAQQTTPSPAQLHAQQVESRRHYVQEEHEAEYQKALVNIKESVRSVDGPDIKESLQEQIRQWFLECRDATGKFPDFPNPEDGGSASIFAHKTPEQVAAEFAAREEEREKKKKSKGEKDKKGNDRKEKKKEKKEKMKGKKGKGDTEEEEKGWKMTPSNFLPTVVEGAKMYKEVWHNRDEKQNFLQCFDAQLVREEKRLEVEEELRVQVDELMRQELKNLKLVVDRDKGKKKKKVKKSSKKKKKKGRKTGKKKKKKEKDLTADRTIESLYEELVMEGFIIRPKNIKLTDYIGEYSYLGTTLRQADIEPMPSLSDVRQLIALYGVLPLGSQCVHERGPLIRALLLTGPAGVGKKMLVHSLCTETGANLFDLSPATLAGKYPGKSGLQYLLHMVFKVARQLQPSVIWIGDAEKTFYKKVPKLEKEMEPKRLKKSLPKVLKSIKSEDRVLVVGTTRRPFDADIKPFCKVYKKIILIPRPDYASRFTLWKELLQAGGAQLGPKLDLSSLAKVTDGYTQGHILQAIQTVLNSHRLNQQTKRPLTAVEFIPPLARQDPVYKEEEEAFKAWYTRTPLGKKRARAAKASEEEDHKKGKTKGGKSQKKEKKGKTKKRKKKK